VPGISQGGAMLVSDFLPVWRKICSINDLPSEIVWNIYWNGDVIRGKRIEIGVN